MAAPACRPAAIPRMCRRGRARSTPSRRANPGACALLRRRALALAQGHVRLGEAHLIVADGNVHVDELAWDDGHIVDARPLHRAAGRHGRAPCRAAAAARVDAEPRRRVVVRRHAATQRDALGAPRRRRPVARRQRHHSGDESRRRHHGARSGRARRQRRHRSERDLSLDARRHRIRHACRSAPSPNAPAGRIAPDAPVVATIKAELTTLQLLQPWAGTTAVIDGRARIDLAARGTLRDAPLTGTCPGTGLRIDAPQYGLHFVDGRVSARVARSSRHAGRTVAVRGRGHIPRDRNPGRRRRQRERRRGAPRVARREIPCLQPARSPPRRLGRAARSRSRPASSR